MSGCDINPCARLALQVRNKITWIAGELGYDGMDRRCVMQYKILNDKADRFEPVPSRPYPIWVYYFDPKTNLWSKPDKEMWVGPVNKEGSSHKCMHGLGAVGEGR